MKKIAIRLSLPLSIPVLKTGRTTLPFRWSRIGSQSSPMMKRRTSVFSSASLKAPVDPSILSILIPRQPWLVEDSRKLHQKFRIISRATQDSLERKEGSRLVKSAECRCSRPTVEDGSAWTTTAMSDTTTFIPQDIIYHEATQKKYYNIFKFK